MPTKIAEYVYVREETGYVFVAMTVPPELRPFIKGGPKAKLSRSLGVPPPLTGDAKRKATQTIAEFQGMIDDARKQLAVTQALSRAEEAERDRQRSLQAIGIFGGDGFIAKDDDGAPDPTPPSLTDMLDLVASGWPNAEACNDVLDEAVKRVKGARDSTRQLVHMESYINAESARLDAARTMLHRLKATTTPKIEAALDSTLTVSRLLEKFLKDHPKTSDTERQYRTAVSLYLSNQDDKPVHSITRADVLAFRSYLHGRTDLSFGTCDQRLKKLRTLFSYGADELQVVSRSPFEGIHIDQKAKAGHGSELDRTTIDSELININLTEIVPTFPHSDSMHWPYLIAFFTGARIEEICGLRLDEVGKRWDVNCFHIQPRSEDNRTVKSHKARYAPIHNFLWTDLGFKKFVEERRSSGAKMLFDFPQWRGKFYSGKFSAKMTELRREIEEKRKIDLRDQQSLRHNLNTLFRNAGVHDEWRCLLVGHQYGSRTNAGYGVNDGTLTHISEALHKIDLTPFDFSKLLVTGT